MLCLVTGAAGFIGSHLVDELLRRGHTVRALDSFVPYYPEAIKRRNLALAAKHSHCRFLPLDLRYDDLTEAVQGVEVIFHLAATPGLVASWTQMDLYISCNIVATHRLLEAVRAHCPKLRRFVYASTSSVYGLYANGDESLPTRPVSPYGVTKLAGEQLCQAFVDLANLPLVVLRYFSVYGPRQRPDMGYYRFIRALLLDEEITVNGDGKQVRGNTFVSDAVDATIRAADAVPGEIFNVGGGETADVWDILAHLERIIGKKPRIRMAPARPGDQRYTGADTRKIRRHLGWEAKVPLSEGLTQQVAWQKAECAQNTDLMTAVSDEQPQGTRP